MKILIVDDHAYNRDLLSFILTDEGHECVEAQDGEVALNILRDDREIELILMDINMPNMDGIECTKIIKNQHQDNFVPVIFVTALDDADIVSKCLESGGDDFVPKPVNENVLLAKVKAHSRTKSLYNDLMNSKNALEYHRQMMDREHAIVEHVFKKGLDRNEIESLNISKYTSPMSMFNGDIVLDASSPSGGLYTLIGDFTGHGLAASIGSLPVTEIFYKHASTQSDISQIAEEINTRLFNLLPSNMFFSAAISFLDHAGKNFSLWSGGMNDIYVVNGGKINQRIASSYMPMGILEPQEFEKSSMVIELEPEDKVYMYTDGVNEAEGEDGELFGFDRLEEIIQSSAEDIVNKLADAVHEFQHADGQADDISLVEITAGVVRHRNRSSGELITVSRAHAAKSFPWELKIHLENQDLKTTSIISQIMSFVASIEGIELHKDKIFTIVSELYSNALEHGVLDLNSSLKDTADGFEEYYKLREERLANVKDGFIDITFTYVRNDPNYIALTMTDSGKGFDVEKIMDQLKSDERAHGRGLMLLESLCSGLEVVDDGRTVTAKYDLVLDYPE